MKVKNNENEDKWKRVETDAKYRGRKKKKAILYLKCI